MSENRNVLVVGGAGYIGSHNCLLLAERGYTPIVFDNLSNGHAEFVKWGPLEIGDIRNRDELDIVFKKYNPIAVLHFASLIDVADSIRNPIAFYENNVSGSMNVLFSAMSAGVSKFVFSSTCATYGLPLFVPLDETHLQAPINPYGRTKYLVEQVIQDLSANMGLKAVILRYFNAAGADFAGRIGERHSPETHAIPLAIEAAQGKRRGFKVFGIDYDTRDGTCIRDYVHVLDLADAHVRALDYLISGGETVDLNLGTGSGTTVKELIAGICQATGRSFPVEYTNRRDGDSTILVANNDKARKFLGWEPKYNLQDIIRSAWEWHCQTRV